MITLTGSARLISDLHLQPEQTLVNARFERFLAQCAAARIDALFILGDLFEYWIGDDARSDAFNAHVASLLKGLANTGVRIFFQHGNRDFLIGSAMADACGMVLLPEIAQVGAGETAILLMHGDALCTDDVDYQQFRAMVRAPGWQSGFLARPLNDRLAEVARLRAGSKQAMQDKSAQIMDASPGAVIEALRQYGCHRLIHGHTHRPGVEQLMLDGQSAERWVLSDWTATRGDALLLDADGHLSRLALTD